MSGAQRLQESSTDSRDHAIRKNYKGETECLLIHKVIMPKVSQMKSVLMFRQSARRKVNTALSEHGKVCRTLLLSGEKGRTIEDGG